MIRLVGRVNGVEVTFTLTPPNVFRGIVPASLHGQYYLDLKAVDEAGNQTNYMDLYVLIDFDALSFKILEGKYDFNVDDSNRDDSLELLDVYLNSEIGSDFSYSLYTSYDFIRLQDHCEMSSKSMNETYRTNSVDNQDYEEILNGIENWNSHSEFSYLLYKPYGFKELMLDENI